MLFFSQRYKFYPNLSQSFYYQVRIIEVGRERKLEDNTIKKTRKKVSHSVAPLLKNPEIRICYN